MEKTCLALKGTNRTFAFAWTQLFPTEAQPTQTKKNAACSYLLHYACSVFFSDPPKSLLHSFSLLPILLGLTAISAYLCLFVVRVLSGLVSVSPSGLSTVSRCSPWVPCWASHTRITYTRIKTQSPQHVQHQSSVGKGITNHSDDFNKKPKLITDLLAITMIDWQLNSSMFQSDEL